MSPAPFKAASIGIGWWSDVLADAAARTNGRVQIVSCFTRSEDKRQAFAEKYGCRAAESFGNFWGLDADLVSNLTHKSAQLTGCSQARAKNQFTSTAGEI